MCVCIQMSVWPSTWVGLCNKPGWQRRGHRRIWLQWVWSDSQSSLFSLVLLYYEYSCIIRMVLSGEIIILWCYTISPILQRVNEKPQVVNDYESGRAIPNQQVISKLERAVGVKLRGKDMGLPLHGPKKKWHCQKIYYIIKSFVHEIYYNNVSSWSRWYCYNDIFSFCAKNWQLVHTIILLSWQHNHVTVSILIDTGVTQVY